MRACVIGGSVSGLHSALFLLKSGVDVTIVERKRKIGENIICAGGVASYMIRKVKIDIPNEFVATKVNRVRFYSPSMKYSEMDIGKEYGLILWREKWEEWIGNEVGSIGGKICLGVRDPTGFIKDCDLVVGADGIAGITRRLVGCKPLPRGDVHIAVQAVCRVNLPDDAISLFLGKRVAPEGYAWAFPIGGRMFRVGLGVPLTHSKFLHDLFSNLINDINASYLEKPKAKVIPTAHPEESLVYDFMGKPLVLVGDAGLHTDPATGGGIMQAVLAAKCLSKAVSSGDIKVYDRIWRKELYGRNSKRYTLKKILCELEDDEFEVIVGELQKMKPVNGSIGLTLMKLIAKVAVKHPSMIIKHKIIRKLIGFGEVAMF